MHPPAALVQAVAMCTAWAILVGAAEYLGFQPLVRQELATVDWRFRVRGRLPAPPDIVIVAIDQPSCSLADRFDPLPEELTDLRQFPYPRHVYADAIERLAAAGVRSIGLDLLFFSPKSGDDQLRAAVERHRHRVVLGSNFSDHGQQLLQPAVVVPATVPLAEVSGFVNFWPDRDDVVRHAQFQQYRSTVAGVAPSADESPEISLVARMAQQAANVAVPAGPVAINYRGPSATFRMISFYQLFYSRSWSEALRHGAALRDKLVLIGPTGNFHHDQHPTPWGLMDGVEIHANALATLWLNNAVQTAPRWGTWLTLLGLAGVTAVTLLTRWHPLLKLGALAGLCLGYAAAALALFTAKGLLLAMAAPAWTAAGGGVLGIAWQVALERLEKLRVRRTLDRYVSKQVAEEVLRQGDDFAASLGGQRRLVTVLFSDIRGFTTLSEQSNPVELVRQLNEYLTAMVAVVMKYDGTLDKFVGDAIMAVWGAPTSAGPAEDAWRAVQTAVEMRARLTELPHRWHIGIGLNHGEVVVGNIGSPQRMEYTVIGDPVNVASRVEGLNKSFGTDILLTESVYALVKDRVEVRCVGDVPVKGRARPIKVYALLKIVPTV